VSRIFISYRREDSDIWAGRLADVLREHFPPEQVFQDIASVDPGADFRKVLDEALATAGAMLVIIGPRWLSVTDRNRRKRLESPVDIVHQEVAESLRRPGIRVFPLLVNGAEMPVEDDLPEPLKPLARRQAFELTVRHWASDVAQLVQTLKRAPGLADIRDSGDATARQTVEQEAKGREAEERTTKDEIRRIDAEEQAKRKAEEEGRHKAEEEARHKAEEEARRKAAIAAGDIAATLKAGEARELSVTEPLGTERAQGPKMDVSIVSTEARGGIGAPDAQQPVSKYRLAIIGALAAAIAVAGGGLLYNRTVSEENTGIDQARSDSAKANADADAPAKTAKAEADKARAEAETAKAAGPTTQGESNRVAAAQVQPDAPKITSRVPSGKDLFPPEYFEYLLKERIGPDKPDTPELREEVRMELNTRALLLREAQKLGMSYDPAIQGVADPMNRAQIALAAQTAVVRVYMADWLMKHPISEADLMKEYNTIKSQMGDKEYRVRHILVETEVEAKDVISELQKGGNFAELAKARSIDKGSKDLGGDLDWCTPANFVKPFSDAMVALPKGKFTTTPVHTQFGWHLIKVDDIRASKVPSFDEVKPQLQQRMRGKEVDKYLEELRAKNGF
jgi:peptidyl-prolyl cis-trans isomerase C